ncbi:MAG: A/G-specific adenine glycosylase [Zoogloeaceae bacterium]|jgi:A/G-specific adenine glycosylase|nr:A/G-specific adenine glycosylase [Zoogloeaceae bacterium]
MKSFARRIVHWQRRHGRNHLPWQNTRDPYRVWLSEIMLQQTQVKTVLAYFPRFVARFPSVETLASASPDEALAHWAGLGYYARARNLHAAARAVVERHGGRFPDTAAELAELPGVGRSTAAAIAAFVSHERAAILDGNVKRVLCRHFMIADAASGKAQKHLWSLAESLLPAPGKSADMPAYTQGLMDLGATVCLKNAPRCDACPLSDTCGARLQNRQTDFPARVLRKRKAEKSGTFLFIRNKTHILLKRRPPSGVWGGLLCPPQKEDDLPPALKTALRTQKVLPSVIHTFTHFRLEIIPEVCWVDLPPSAVSEPGWEWLRLPDALKAGLPAPMARLLAGLPDDVQAAA